MNNPRQYCEVFSCIETETQTYRVNGVQKQLCEEHAVQAFQKIVAEVQSKTRKLPIVGSTLDELKREEKGTAFACTKCGATVYRTRENPYPEIKHMEFCPEHRADLEAERKEKEK